MIVSTIFPNVSLLAINSWANSASSTANSRSTMAFIVPSSINGQTRSFNASSTNAFAPTVRARSVDPITRNRRVIIIPSGNSAREPPSNPITTNRPSKFRLAKLSAEISTPHRVKDHIGPLAVGPVGYRVHEPALMPVDAPVRPELDAARHLLVGADGHERGVAERLAHLDRGGADAARAGMEHGALAPHHPRLHEQVQVGGGEHLRNRRRFRERKPRRLRQHLAGWNRDGFGVAAARQQGTDLVALLDAAGRPRRRP